MTSNPCTTLARDMQQLCNESRPQVSPGRKVTSPIQAKPLTLGGDPCLAWVLLSKLGPTAAMSPPGYDLEVGLGYNSVRDV